MIYIDDTIAAIATGLGAGGIGIVRISGPDAWKVGQRLFTPIGAPSGECPGFRSSNAFRQMSFGVIRDPASGEPIDQVLTTFMVGPHTYTGEHTVEINSHGGRIVLSRVLELALASGARMADPGEFTRRAFLNGRMDLTQAEAVVELIQARSDLARRRAIGVLQGGLREIVTECRDRIIALRSQISAGIDFPDEVGELVDSEGEAGRLTALVIDRLSPICRRYRHTRVLTDGVRVAIVGRPNVGKSSLLNALLQRDRAIVTDTPGTTRDTIEEAVDVGGIPVVFIDTAGLRDTDDPVEQMGISRALAAADEAQIVLFIIDATAGLVDGDRPYFERIDPDKSILVINKIDIESQRVERMLEWQTVRISAKTRAGIETLESAIRHRAICDDFEPEALSTAPNLRQATALEDAISATRAAARGLAQGSPEIIVDIDLVAAQTALDTVLGDAAGADLLDEIFSRFCIGK